LIALLPLPSLVAGLEQVGADWLEWIVANPRRLDRLATRAMVGTGSLECHGEASRAGHVAAEML